MAHTSTKKRKNHEEPGNNQTNGQSPPTMEVTSKKVLAEAIRHLGVKATHADLVQFAKEQFGLDLHFVIVIPKRFLKTAGQNGRASGSQARRKAG